MHLEASKTFPSSALTPTGLTLILHSWLYALGFNLVSWSLGARLGLGLVSYTLALVLLALQPTRTWIGTLGSLSKHTRAWSNALSITLSPLNLATPLLLGECYTRSACVCPFHFPHGLVFLCYDLISSQVLFLSMLLSILDLLAHSFNSHLVLSCFDVSFASFELPLHARSRAV